MTDSLWPPSPARPPRVADRFGFSLVEVLVVVAILLVLLGLLLPALVTARADARQDGCLMNQKEAARGLLLLAYDTPLSESAPGFPGLEGATLPKAWTAGDRTWADAVLPYLENEEGVLHCPERTGGGPERRAYGLNLLAGARIEPVTGGVVNGFLLTPGWAGPRPLANIAHPARTVLLAEAGRVTEPSASRAPAAWVEATAAAWWPGVVFPVRTDPDGPFPRAYGYDWGTEMPGAGVPEGGWEPRQRAIDRHGIGAVGVIHVDGSARTEPPGALSGAIWGGPDCLFDNEP